MATPDTDYNPAIRKEIKADAETGRTFKKWKHRAQGAAVGTAAGAIGALAGIRALKKKFDSTVPTTNLSFDSVAGKIASKEGLPEGRAKAILASSSRHASAKAVHKNPKLLRVPRGHHHDKAKHMSAFVKDRVTNLSLHGGFKEMVESAVRLKKTHAKAWKEMSAKEREQNRAELRIHRDALNDQQSAADTASYSPSVGFRSGIKTTNLECGNVMGERHPALTPMDPEELKRKKLNVGQTGPQSPLMPQPTLVKIKAKTVQMSARRFPLNFAADNNGRPHSAAGTFEPDVDGINPAMVRKAYSPTDRVTGRSPMRKSIERSIAKRALARIGKTTEM